MDTLYSHYRTQCSYTCVHFNDEYLLRICLAIFAQPCNYSSASAACATQAQALWSCMWGKKKQTSELHPPQIPPRRQACAGRLCSLSSRSASGSSPSRASGPSCASPPPDHRPTAHRWQRRAAGCTAAPGVCLWRRQRAVVGPGGGSVGMCPLSSPRRRSWASQHWSHCSTSGPSAPHAGSLPPHDLYILGRSLSSTSHGSQWRISPLLQFWAPLRPLTVWLQICL